jgi:ubiquinone/menaquinone biosynthesis C-methylase UbiE
MAMLRLLRRRVINPLLRYAFHLFYNPFAFTYDFVSAVVSRGRWRAWTGAAIPRVVGTRVLEIPCGTGNLLLDLVAAGYSPMGADLSPEMIRITQRKLSRHAVQFPLVRARAQELPFPSHSFDTIVMTFPPEFVYDPRALAEFRRLLDDRGRLVWVDAGRLLPNAWWSRFLNRALDAADGEPVVTQEHGFARGAGDLLARAGFQVQVEQVRDDVSVVMVVIATQEPAAWTA